MPLHIVRNDLIKMKVDAIVNATDCTLSGSGGADRCIHQAAGPRLRAACDALGGCEVGQARLTEAYELPCRYIIHTVGPHWLDGTHGESEQLAACYHNALELGQAHGCETVAFPLIASGVNGYPKELALQTAVESIRAFLEQADMTVYLVVFDRAAYRISSRLHDEVTAYISDCYADAHTDFRARASRTFGPALTWSSTAASAAVAGATVGSAPMPLEDMLKQLDESFSEMLLRKIDERGMTDAQCYKKANIDRRLFAKIRADKNYKPSKPTAVAFALALELPYGELTDMLRKAGFALSHSNKFDVIIEYFVQNGIYDVMEINSVLFEFDQSLLGTSA